MTAIEHAPPAESTATQRAASPSAEGKLGKCQPDKEPYLQALLSLYVEKSKRPKKDQRRIGKQIHSLLQGYDGKKAECYKCSILSDINFMETHHINEEPSDNRIINTPPIHGKCNRELNGSKGGKVNAERSAAYRQQYRIVASDIGRESERGAPARTPTDESQGSPELRKHNSMRPRYDAWVRNTATGPFANRYTWPRDLLADAAPYACSHELGKAFGSRKTYLSYINEDIQGGILLAEDREGVINVILNKELMQKIQEATGQ